MNIRFLGAHNAESKNTRMASILIDDNLALDAGSLVSQLTFKEQEKNNQRIISGGQPMHARVISGLISSGKREKAISIFQDNVVPRAKEQEGFKGILLLADEETNKFYSITLAFSNYEINHFVFFIRIQ